MGLPMCCGNIMRVGTTSIDKKSQVIYCIKCMRQVVRGTAKKEEKADG